MATQKEIELCQEILGLAIKINMQGKYHVFADFSGHVLWMEVRVYPVPANQNKPLKGWLGSGGMLDDESYVKLSTGYQVAEGEALSDVIEHKVEQLKRLLSKLAALLDVDADGVPV